MLKRLWPWAPELLTCILLGGYLRYRDLTMSGIWRDEAQLLGIVELPSTSSMLDSQIS